MLVLSQAVFILKELTMVNFQAWKKRSTSEKNEPRGKVVMAQWTSVTRRKLS